MSVKVRENSGNELEEAKELLAEALDVMSGIYTAYCNYEGGEKYRMSNDGIENEDVTLLKVKGNIEDRDERKKYVRQLSQALLAVIQKHDVAHMRCVGVASIRNAVNAHIEAKGEASKKDVILASVPSFKTVQFTSREGEVVDRTAYVLEIRPVKDFG